MHITSQSFEVQEEPHYRAQEELRKPDIVATMGTLVLVIDAQIVSEQSDLERKSGLPKSGNTPTILTSNGPYIRHLPVILSWRGIWCETSASDFPTLGTTATSIAQPWSRSEDDIARKKTSHSLGAACRSQAQATLPLLRKVYIYIVRMEMYSMCERTTVSRAR